jgi:hypothetical protein
MRLVRAGILGAVFGAVMFITSPAYAGGAMWELDGHSYYEVAFTPGDEVHASTSVWISNPGLGRPQDGPFDGYLLAARKAVYPPPVPEEAIFLGEISIDAHEPAASHSVARLTFTLPDVEPGRYWLIHCNDPCSTSLGDIVTTPIEVVGGPGEEKLLVELGRLERRFEQRSFILGRSVRSLGAQLASQIGRMEVRVEKLEERVKRFENRSETESGLLEGGLAAGAVILVLSAFHFVTARRGA